MISGKQFLLRVLPTFLSVFIWITASAQNKPQSLVVDDSGIPKDRVIDITHIRLDAFIDAPRQWFRGTARMDFTALRSGRDSIVFYAPGMNDIRVWMNDSGIKSYNEGENLILFPGESLASGQKGTLRFEYTVTNPRELHFIGWEDPTVRGRKQIWAHRPFGWIPFHDEMGTQEIFISFDKNFQVVSNGERISKTLQGDSVFVWHYRLDKPHPFYSTCLVIGDYLLKPSLSTEGLPLEMWIYPDQENRYPYTYNLMNEMLTFMTKETGTPYPYSLYRNIPVMNYLYGAMETTSSTIFGDYMVNDARSVSGRAYLNTNIHELAHQWFGNCINDKTVRDLWLTESFATFYAKRFEKQYLGEDAYEFQRDQERQKALKIAQSNSFPLASGKAGVERWYQKGSLVMDMLLDILGEEDFRKAIRYYLARHAYSEAESNDFLRAIYETSGKSLDWFFMQWIYKGGEPEFKISYRVLPSGSGSATLQLRIDQIQQQNEYVGLFKVPVDIEIHYTDGTQTRSREWISEQSTLLSFVVPGNKVPEFVVFDAGNRLLKKTVFPRPEPELLAQAVRGTHIADRLEAIRALKTVAVDKKRSVLTECFSKEQFHLIKTEIIEQLASDSLSIPLLKLAIKDKDHRVRKAICDYVRIIPPQLLPEYELLLMDSSVFIVESALVNLTTTLMMDKSANPAQINRYFELTAKETGWRGVNIRIAWLCQKLLLEPANKPALLKLADYSSPVYEFETRMNAISSLQKLNYLDDFSLNFLIQACLHWNFKLNAVAKEALRYYYRQLKYKILIDKYLGTPGLDSDDKTRILQLLNEGR